MMVEMAIRIFVRLCVHFLFHPSQSARRMGHPLCCFVPARSKVPMLPATEMNVGVPSASLRAGSSTPQDDSLRESFCYAQDDNLEWTVSQRTDLRSFRTLL